ncbi:apolipoprotein N-acyltransferase [Candidatus Poribacteria bacterium]|jgi:apolipoprotein N-acyltransferase|nr:apolipoprotein N-acyltransferase [Candidatus Poribacteria bacterium]MBT5533118.1 apolipoprotein N-acyltransferase [Candidatus Poribacteria bacterium]MBT5713153.1 apolipoprotein N-acyltransferase [Candidatus Poribacteria bacterium]MBT7097916.1 apolipoprotein N-acyltransferase [Candidatus Poribacteria bacterium]
MTQRFQARWHAPAFVVAHAALTILSHPDAALSFLGWVSLVPILLLVHSVDDWRRAARLSWVAGSLAYFGTIVWLCTVGQYSGMGPTWGWIAGVFGALVLSSYMGLYVALFAGLTAALLRPSGWRYGLGVAVLWTFCEWLRSWVITGFPWAALGYTQWNNLLVAQLSRLGGVALVTFVLAVGNAAIARTVWGTRATDRRDLWYARAPATVVLVATVAYGLWALGRDLPEGTTVRVAVVPGNVPQSERWQRDSLATNLRRYIESLEAAAEREPDLIVMPETAIPYPYLTPADSALFVDVAKRLEVPILFGAPRIVSDPRTGGRVSLNSVMVLRTDGSFGDPYDKQHLVPFGEYIPFRRYMPDFLEGVIGIGDQLAGDGVVLLPVQAGGATVLAGVPICFESVFPEIARDFARSGANLIVVITNDGWYDETAAIAQHNAFSVFRAIETGRTLVRAANRGISCVIDANGRTRESTVGPMDRDGIIVEDVPLRAGSTLYVRFGDWVSVLCVAVTGAMLLGRVYRRRRTHAVDDERTE